MPLTANHHQAAKFTHALIKLNIGTTPRNVGCQGNSALFASFGHNGSFVLVILGVQDLVLNTFFIQPLGNQLVLNDGARAHQHRPALLMVGFDRLGHGL